MCYRAGFLLAEYNRTLSLPPSLLRGSLVAHHRIATTSTEVSSRRLVSRVPLSSQPPCASSRAREREREREGGKRRSKRREQEAPRARARARFSLNRVTSRHEGVPAYDRMHSRFRHRAVPRDTPRDKARPRDVPGAGAVPRISPSSALLGPTNGFGNALVIYAINTARREISTGRFSADRLAGATRQTMSGVTILVREPRFITRPFRAMLLRQQRAKRVKRAKRRPIARRRSASLCTCVRARSRKRPTRRGVPASFK